MDLRPLIFMPALVGCIVFGFILALFAANYYLTILQGTAAGGKTVTWASEPIIDNFWKAFYLGGMIVLWLGPGWLLGRAYASGTAPLWLKFAIPLTIFWLFYPVSQLSSLGGPTIWLPFHPGTFERLLKRPAAVLGFVLLSGLNLLVFGIGFYWVFHAPDLFWLFVGCPVLVFAWYFYARLLGRLAFAISYTKSFLERLGKKKRRSEETRSSVRGENRLPREGFGENSTETEEERRPGELQPSELPPIETPDEGPLYGYEVKFQDEPVKAKKRIVAEMAEPEFSAEEDRESETNRSFEGEKVRKPKRKRKKKPVIEDDDLGSYDVHGSDVDPEERVPRSVVEPSALEMKLLSRDDAPKPPTVVWNGELFSFLWQAETMTSAAFLTVMCMVLGGLVRLAKAFNPAADGP